MSSQVPRIAQDLDALCINTIRTLAADAVQKADSGHPGMPMGAAPMAYVLWTRFLRHNPRNPDWCDRDRFVLSAGHGSMLLYALLHLTGYDLPLDEIKRFRQWGSTTPGHPEHGDTPGVETTTGPLGQGFGNAVGMAIAEARLAAEFNTPDHRIVDHRTWVVASDGDIMEGVQSEAASLAGHLGLDKLAVLYDDNHITIDGSTNLSFSEDVGARYAAYGWHVERVDDGNDLDSIERAIEAARDETERPSLICVRTRIGFGSPNRQDTAKAHGEPLGAEEVALTKVELGWPRDAEFLVPEEALRHLRAAVDRGRELEQAWHREFAAWSQTRPEAVVDWERRQNGDLPAGWEEELPEFDPEQGKIATRAASGKVLNALARTLPELIGGSADLTPSNKTLIEGSGDFSRQDRGQRNLRFGIREHAMGAILNGLALHGGVTPYGGTFLIFSDYMRPSVRLAALMGVHVIYVYTHDSVAVGEDGPTHQPVEQISSLRAMPGLAVIRPADANEVREAWRAALLRRSGPTALVLTRQGLPVIDREGIGAGSASELHRGGYVLVDPPGSPTPELLLLATGSEVAEAVVAWKRLVDDGVAARVVCLPCLELFEEQGREYRETVIPPSVRARLAVEAGVSWGWHRYVGDHGDVISIERFGASAPGATNMEKFGFTADNIEQRARALLERVDGAVDG